MELYIFSSHRLSCGLSQQWVTSRQMRFEGGFQGRCNKLVDGCYSFWQAGLLPLLHRALHAQGESTLLLGPEEEPPVCYYPVLLSGV